MARWILFESPFAPNGQVNFARGHSLFLGDPMRKHRRDGSVKKVEHPIMNPLEAYTELINTIAQIIGFRSTELVSEFSETLNLHSALILRSGWDAIEPLEQRHRAIIFLVENHCCPGQPSSCIVLNFENKVK
jgi:hypothetical protein